MDALEAKKAQKKAAKERAEKEKDLALFRRIRGKKLNFDGGNVSFERDGSCGMKSRGNYYVGRWTNGTNWATCHVKQVRSNIKECTFYFSGSNIRGFNCSP